MSSFKWAHPGGVWKKKKSSPVHFVQHSSVVFNFKRQHSHSYKLFVFIHFGENAFITVPNLIEDYIIISI